MNMQKTYNLFYSFTLMKTIYENCLRKVMILKAKDRLWWATDADRALIINLDLFLSDCENAKGTNAI